MKIRRNFPRPRGVKNEEGFASSVKKELPMRCRLFAAVLILCLAGMLPAADPQLLNLALPNAKVLAGANVQQALTSRFGQYLLSRIPASDPGYQEFVNATGLDLARDIREVLASSTAEKGPHAGLLTVRGSFDVKRIAQAAAEKAQVTMEEYQGARILTGKNGREAVAFLDDSIAILGPADDVRAAIGRRSSVNALDPALAAKVNQLSTGQDAWAVSMASLPAGARVPPNFEPLQRVQQSSAGVKFGDVVQVSAEAVAETDKDANALADVIRGLVALAQLNPNKLDVNALALLQTLVVTTERNTVKISLSIPEEQLERLLNTTGGHSRVRKVKAPAR